MPVASTGLAALQVMEWESVGICTSILIRRPSWDVEQMQIWREQRESELHVDEEALCKLVHEKQQLRQKMKIPSSAEDSGTILVLKALHAFAEQKLICRCTYKLHRTPFSQKASDVNNLMWCVPKRDQSLHKWPIYRIFVWPSFSSSSAPASPSSSAYSGISYLVVAVNSSSNLPTALRSCCGDAVAKGEGLVAMVAGRVLERSLRGGVELQGTLGKKSRSYG